MQYIGCKQKAGGGEMLVNKLLYEIQQSLLFISKPFQNIHLHPVQNFHLCANELQIKCEILRYSRNDIISNWVEIYLTHC